MTDNFFKTITARPVGNTFRIIQILFLILAQVGGAAFYDVGPALAAGISIIDDGGANDAVGQNDLTRLTGDDPTSTGFFNVEWSWDEPSAITGGGQAVNGCAMFDTDGDGNVNYSFCVEVSEDEDPLSPTFGQLVVSTPPPPDGDTWFPHWILCSDAKDDRCTQPNRIGDPVDLPGGLGATTCSVAVTATDPFDATAPNGPGSDYPQDITVACDIDATIIPASAEFINVCSYPSAGNDGNNNPFDCVVTPGSGFLTIVKNAPTGSTTPFVFTASTASTNGASSWTINGSGSVTLIPYAPTTTLDLNEAVPSGWKLDSASCVIQSSPTAGTGTSDAPPAQTGPISKGVQNFEIRSGLETICTFTNSLAFVPNPSLTITKSLTNADDAVVDTAGETIEYTIWVENTGNVDLTGVVLGDLFAGGATLVSGDANSNNILETTETWTYSADYTVTQADINAGTNLVNVATVDTDQTDEQQDDATSTVDQNPSLTIVKSLTNGDDAIVDTAGEVIEYTIVVDNTGNVDLTNVMLGDLFAGGATFVSGDDANVGVLDVGETWTYSADYTVTQADLNSGADLVNVATVDTDQTDEQQDDATSTVDQNPSLTIDKVTVYGTQSGDGLSGVIAGNSIGWQYTVDNTGNVDLSNISVADSVTGVTPVYDSGDTNDNGILETTETWIYKASGTAVAGSYSNIGTASGTIGTTTVSDTDPSSYFGTADLGQIAPTGVLCGQYVNGTAPDFSTFYASQGGVVQYQVKANKISATNPGVFFYWTGLSKTITGSGPVFIDQSDNNDNIGPFAPVPNDIKLWLVTGTTCTQVQLAASQITVSNGDVTVNIASPAPAGSYYVISVKYDTGSVKDQNAAGKPTVKFTFTTDVGNNGSIEETDTKGITLAPK